MKFRVERDAFADAVAWTARSLPSRPTVPVLAGVLLTAGEDGLSVSAFDYEVSAQADVAVTIAEPGQALVSGRLLADITRSLPAHPVDMAAEGSGDDQLRLVPVHPPDDADEDYPRPRPCRQWPEPWTAPLQPGRQPGRGGRRPGRHPAHADRRAHGDRRRSADPAATDRHRLAVRELTWKPADANAPAVDVLVPPRTLAEAAKSFTGTDDGRSRCPARVWARASSASAAPGRRATSRLWTPRFRPTGRCCRASSP